MQSHIALGRFSSFSIRFSNLLDLPKVLELVWNFTVFALFHYIFALIPIRNNPKRKLLGNLYAYSTSDHLARALITQDLQQLTFNDTSDVPDAVRQLV